MDPFLVRNLVYGVEDSLISTGGVVIGIALAGLRRSDILTTGIILLLVESLSMGFGSFIAEDNFMATAAMSHSPWTIVKYASVMFMSYMLAGAIPLAPFALDIQHAWQWAFVLTLTSLFALLYWFQRIAKKAMVLTAIGGIILAISVYSGRSLQ